MLQLVVKPRSPLLIRNHPLSRGLVCALPMFSRGGTTARELCIKRDWTIESGITWEQGIPGPYLDLSGTANQVKTTNMPASMSSDLVTLSLLANPVSITIDQYALATAVGGTLNKRSILLGYQDGFWNYFPYPTGADAASQIPAIANVWQLVTYTSDGIRTQGYVDGKQYIDVVGTMDVIGGPLTSSWIGAANDAGAAPYGGSVALLLWYSRHFIANEVAQLAADPFAILRPQPLPILKSSAVALSTVQLDWTDNAENETGFSIERSIVSAVAGFAEIDTTAADVETYDDDNLAADTYWYRVRAFDADVVYSEYSNVAEVTVT